MTEMLSQRAVEPKMTSQPPKISYLLGFKDPDFGIVFGRKKPKTDQDF